MDDTAAGNNEIKHSFFFFFTFLWCCLAALFDPLYVYAYVYVYIFPLFFFFFKIFTCVWMYWRRGEEMSESFEWNEEKWLRGHTLPLIFLRFLFFIIKKYIYIFTFWNDTALALYHYIIFRCYYIYWWENLLLLLVLFSSIMLPKRVYLFIVCLFL